MSVDELLSYIESRFGISREVFENYKFKVKGRDVWIFSEDAPEDLKGLNRVGLRFARGLGKSVKLTTAVIQIFGKYATRNVYEISEEKLEDFLRGKDVEIGEVNSIDRGQVIVKFGEDILGSALYDGKTLKNQIPKARRLV